MTHLNLYNPFFIGSALVPAIKIGDATLSLLETRTGHRDTAVFELQTPTFTYVDDRMMSGFQGFVSTVEVFEAFLGFLEAAVESFEYEQHTGCEGENATLFPPHVVEWAVANKSDLQTAVLEITDDSGEANHNLIEG